DLFLRRHLCVRRRAKNLHRSGRQWQILAKGIAATFERQSRLISQSTLRDIKRHLKPHDLPGPDKAYGLVDRWRAPDGQGAVGLSGLPKEIARAFIAHRAELVRALEFFGVARDHLWRGLAKSQAGSRPTAEMHNRESNRAVVNLQRRVFALEANHVEERAP